MRLIILLFLLCPVVFAQICTESQYRITLPERSTESCVDGQWAQSEFEVFDAKANPSLFSRLSLWWRTSVSPLFEREEKPVEEKGSLPSQEPEPLPKVPTPEKAPIPEPEPIEIPKLVKPTLQEQTPVEQEVPLCGDILSDRLNCGACGSVCPELAGTFIQCIKGNCVQECERGFVDSNKDTRDGCECAQDIYEPNDALANATDLGTVLQGQQRTLVLHAGEYDYFKIYAQHIHGTEFEIRAASNDKIDICIYKESQILSCKRGSNAFTERTGIISGEGYYYISAFNPDCIQYTLLIKNS